MNGTFINNINIGAYEQEIKVDDTLGIGCNLSSSECFEREDVLMFKLVKIANVSTEVEVLSDDETETAVKLEDSVCKLKFPKAVDNRLTLDLSSVIDILSDDELEAVKTPLMPEDITEPFPLVKVKDEATVICVESDEENERANDSDLDSINDDIKHMDLERPLFFQRELKEEMQELDEYMSQSMDNQDLAGGSPKQNFQGTSPVRDPSPVDELSMLYEMHSNSSDSSIGTINIKTEPMSQTPSFWPEGEIEPIEIIDDDGDNDIMNIWLDRQVKNPMERIRFGNKRKIETNDVSECPLSKKITTETNAPIPQSSVSTNGSVSLVNEINNTLELPNHEANITLPSLPIALVNKNITECDIHIAESPTNNALKPNHVENKVNQSGEASTSQQPLQKSMVANNSTTHSKLKSILHNVNKNLDCIKINNSNIKPIQQVIPPEILPVQPSTISTIVIPESMENPKINPNSPSNVLNAPRAKILPQRRSSILIDAKPLKTRRASTRPDQILETTKKLLKNEELKVKFKKSTASKSSKKQLIELQENRKTKLKSIAEANKPVVESVARVYTKPKVKVTQNNRGCFLTDDANIPPKPQDIKNSKRNVPKIDVLKKTEPIGSSRRPLQSTNETMQATAIEESVAVPISTVELQIQSAIDSSLESYCPPPTLHRQAHKPKHLIAPTSIDDNFELPPILERQSNHPPSIPQTAKPSAIDSTSHFIIHNGVAIKSILTKSSIRRPKRNVRFNSTPSVREFYTENPDAINIIISTITFWSPDWLMEKTPPINGYGYEPLPMLHNYLSFQSYLEYDLCFYFKMNVT